MKPMRFVSLVAIAGALLVIGGCGGSAKPQSGTAAPASAQSPISETAKPTALLTRAQLIAKGDAICYRLNVRRSATRIERPQDYETLFPALAAYELTGATEMSNLTPPTSMARDWQQMIAGARNVARATAMVHTDSEARSKAFSERVEPVLFAGIKQLTAAARRAGFKECSHFP